MVRFNKENENNSQLVATSISIVNEISVIPQDIETDNDRLISTELATKLVGDVVVACSVTFGVSPCMTMIDKSIVQKAAGTHTVVQSCIESASSLIRNPLNYVKSPMFLMMWGVYAATYTTANCLKTIVEHQENKLNYSNMNRNESSSASGSGHFAVFALTTAVNSSTTMMKDKFYAARFGTTAIAKMPLITYGLWGLRDCMVIGSSFILPEYTSNVLKEYTQLDPKTALQVSQVACPVVTQVVAGPTQLLGLDMYNRPMKDLTFKAAAIERIQFQRANFSSILGARIARIAPAYGIGGLGNTYFRDMWRSKIVKDIDF